MNDEFEKWREQIHKKNHGYTMEIVFVAWIIVIVATALWGLF